MNTLKLIAFTISIFLTTTQMIAQKRGHGGSVGHGGHGGHHQGGGRNKVVVRSPFRPNKVVVYHPYWHKNYAYNRRWVYFPKYNLYWDNWRNHYVFWNGAIWLSQPTAPPIIINVNLDKEKNVELKENADDVDDVYKDNNKHKEEIKPD